MTTGIVVVLPEELEPPDGGVDVEVVVPVIVRDVVNVLSAAWAMEIENAHTDTAHKNIFITLPFACDFIFNFDVSVCM